MWLRCQGRALGTGKAVAHIPAVHASAYLLFGINWLRVSVTS